MNANELEILIYPFSLDFCTAETIIASATDRLPGAPLTLSTDVATPILAVDLYGIHGSIIYSWWSSWFRFVPKFHDIVERARAYFKTPPVTPMKGGKMKNCFFKL